MLEDAQYEYLVKFFDGGSLKRLKTQLNNAEIAIKKITQETSLANAEIEKLVGAQATAARLGFGANPKDFRASNSFIAAGSGDAERKNAIVRGEIARRDANISERIVKLKTDAHNRLRKHFTALERQQAIALTSLSQQEFADRKVTDLKQAQIKLEAAKLRAGLASQALLNNTDGRSNNRLTRQLGTAQLDVSNLEQQVSAFKKMEVSNNKILRVRERLDKIESRAATLARARAEGATTTSNAELRSLVQQRSKLRLEEAELNAERLTTAELDKQRVIASRISRARTKGVGIDGEQEKNPLDSLNKRLEDGGAGLLKIQAQLLANYAAMGLALRTLSFAGRFVVDLDKQFAQLQAITASTDQSMGQLERTVIKVSEGVKFTALEVAEAATIMGQAGFSADQISASLQNITNLATAVGTDLKTAVDLVTSTISVFNLRAEEAGTIANTFTTAVNNSKLNLEKLTLGLQFSGNIAHELNITFSELTATLGAMANSGIRSGSTLGTGLRQILTALAAPSDKLRARLDELGLSTDDVDVKLHGLTGVLSNLQEAGFTTTDALQVLEVRAGAAFAALTNNAGTIDELREKFLINASAAEANAVQMEALANKGLRLQSIFGTVVAKALAPLVDVAKLAVDALSFLLSTLNKLGPVIPILTTAVVAYTAAIIANRAAHLVANLTRKTTIATLFGEAAAARAAGLGYKGLLVAMGPVGGGIAAITAVIGLAKIGIDFFTTSVDELKSRVDKFTGSIDTTEQNIGALEGQIDKLNSRFFDSETSMEEVRNIAIELQQKFGDLGAQFDITGSSSSQLVDELTRLKNSMLDLKQAELALSISSSEDLIKRQRKDLVRDFRDSSVINSDDELKGAFETVRGGDTSVDAVSNLFNILSNRRGEIADRLNRLNGTPETVAAEVARARSNGRLFENTEDDARVAMLERSFSEINLKLLDELANKLTPLFAEVLNQEKRIGDAQLTAFQRDDQFRDFEARRQQLQVGLTNIKGDSSLSKDQKNVRIEELIPQVKALGEEAKKAFTNQSDLFDQTGFASDIAGLAHTMKQATLLSDAELKEQKALNQAKKSAFQAEIQTIKSKNTIQSSATESAIAREKALGLLAGKQLVEKEAEIQRLDKSFASDKVVKAKLSELDRKHIAERERLVEAFNKVDLAREVRKQGVSFKSLNQQLEAEIKVEKDRVNSKSSVNEIEKAKLRALALTTQQEIAARDDLRFRLRNDADLLTVEMAKLNTSLAANRLGIASSFDDLLVDMNTKRNPALKTALKKLTDSFDKAAREFDKKVADLQKPVQDLETSRRALDSPNNVNNFGDIHREELDRAIIEAQVNAMRQEIALLKKDSLLTLRNQEAALRQQREEITAALLEAQATITNADGTASPDEMKIALSEIERLKRSGLEVDDLLSQKATEIEEKLKKIRDLQAEIGAITGAAAPDAFTWTEAMVKGLQDYIKWLDEATIKSDEFADVASGVMQDATNELGDAFFDIVTGAKSVGEAFGDLVKSVLSAILKLLAQQAAIFAVKQLFAAFGIPVQSFSGGGQVKRLARGGTVPNVGVIGRDFTPVLAEAGEFVLRKSAVDSIGTDKLHSLNTLGKDAFEDSGIKAVAVPDLQGGPKEVNVYVVSPEEKPQLGPDDVIHIIGQDLAKGGQTKRLVKQVVL